MGAKSVGIVQFLGTNCDRDVMQAAKLAQLNARYLWFEDQFDVNEYDSIFIPGGFSYGDYLRCGALAAKSPVMKSVREAAEKGVPILGICNGFQILCEAQLLPGVLLKNVGLKFIDRWVELKIESKGPFGAKSIAKTYRLPIAHGEGRYFAEEDELKRLHDNGQVWLTYLDNPNGSFKNIAGLKNKNGNVAALMPHPERAIFDWMGSGDGLSFFTSIQGRG